MKNNYDDAIKKLETDGYYFLESQNQATTYRWVHGINLELQRRNLPWRVKPKYKERKIIVKDPSKLPKGNE